MRKLILSGFYAPKQTKTTARVNFFNRIRKFIASRSPKFCRKRAKRDIGPVIETARSYLI